MMGNSKIQYRTDSLCTSIVYTLDPDERLDAFTNGMLMNNNIKGLLAQSCEINNNVCTLSYTVSRGMPLSTLIKQSMKKEVILTILKNVADVIVRAEEYMLDVDKIMLDNDYVFVNTNTLEPYMIIIPTNKPYGKPFRAFIKNCIVTGVFDLSGDASYVMQINNFLNVKTNASAKEISEFLGGLLEVKETGVPASVSVTPQPVPQPPVRETPVNVNPPADKPEPTFAQKTPKTAPKENQPRKMGLFGMFEKKEKKQAGSFAGMDIPGVEGSVPQSAKPDKTKKPPKPEKASKLEKPKPFMKNDQPMPIPNFPNSAPQPIPMVQGYPGDYEDTLPSFGQEDSEKTVLMGQPSAAGAVVGVLEQRNGTPVTIDKDCFFIGKGTNTSIVNDLVIRNENVSRNHAVIERAGGVFYVKDNNSTNGTFVNGNRITPNVRQEIKNGDLVVFANEEYVFRTKRS